jgi:hypothetical protein
LDEDGWVEEEEKDEGGEPDAKCEEPDEDMWEEGKEDKEKEPDVT